MIEPHTKRRDVTRHNHCVDARPFQQKAVHHIRTHRPNNNRSVHRHFNNRGRKRKLLQHQSDYGGTVRLHCGSHIRLNKLAGSMDLIRLNGFHTRGQCIMKKRGTCRKGCYYENRDRTNNQDPAVLRSSYFFFRQVAAAQQIVGAHILTLPQLGSWQVREEVKCVPDDQQTEHSDRGDDYGSMWPSAQCRNCYLSATGVGYVFWQVGRRGYELTGCIGRGIGWFIHKTAVSNIVKLPNANQRRNLLVVQNRRPLLAYHLRLKRTRRGTSD